MNVIYRTILLPIKIKLQILLNNDYINCNKSDQI